MKNPRHYISEISHLIKEWNWDKNKNCSPDTIGTGSSRKVWWKCCVCGSEWQATPNSRSGKKKSGCPECGKKISLSHRISTQIAKRGSLASTHPYLLQEWDYKKNDIQPEDIPSQTRLKVWWKCKDCGHEWQAVVQSRTRSGNGCPKCGRAKSTIVREHNKLLKTGTLIQTHPDLIKEWDYELNGITPDSITWHYSKKVHWICRKGHEFLSAPNRRVKLGTGCPICAKEGGTSFPEQTIYFYLNSVIPTVNRYLHNGIEIDVYIPSLKIGIEYDGRYYHNTGKSAVKEAKKNESLKKDGIRLIRIKESQECRLGEDIIYTVPTKNYDYLINVINSIFQIIGIEKDIDIDPIRDRIAIFEQYILNEKENSIIAKLPNIAKQWDYEKNGRIKPEYIRVGANQKFWWKCERGHSWEAPVYGRANGNMCPCCSGKVLVVGENDLLSRNPTLASEWNEEKNGDLTPEMITFRNGRKVWWKCKDCGHEWKTSVAHRSEGEGCPICGRRKSDKSRSKSFLKKNGSFIDVKSELLKEWDFEKNGSVSPYDITANNGGKYWWRCSKCGHSWQAIVANRTSKGSGCPECAKTLRGMAYIRLAINKTGSIAKTHPHLLADWDYKKNNIQPSNISIGSDRKVWWKCHFCGYEWEAAPNSSNRKKSPEKGCPVCQRKVVWVGHNDLATTNPTLASEWNYARNGDLRPSLLTDGSNKKVWWKCKDCGHEWEAVIAKRAKGKCKCPYCKKM